MITRVETLSHCVRCGFCQEACPRVFRRCRWTGMSEVVTDDFAAGEDAIVRAARCCPVCNIVVEQDGVAAAEVFATVAVAAVRRLTPSVFELGIVHPAAEFRPGQYVTVRWQDRHGVFHRPYSVVRHQDGCLFFCIRPTPGGRAAGLLGRLRPGDTVAVSQPKGEFGVLPGGEAPAGEGPSQVFVATGTGIAPVLAMARSRPADRKTILFGVRHETDLLYAAELRALPNTDVVLTLSSPPAGWTQRQGRVTEHLTTLGITPQTEVYLCGHPDMVRDVKSRLLERGHPARLVVSEAFTQAVDGSQPVVGQPRLADRLARWLRDLHYYLSMPVAAVFLFYAVTGFLANRASRFSAETQDQPAAGEARRPIPETVALTPPEVVRWLGGRYSGDVDLANVEDGDEQIVFDAESVWGTHSFVVHKKDREYSVNTRRASWTQAVVGLHRGKHAGGFQRLLVDLVAGLWVFLALSGVYMAVAGPGTRRRKAVAAVMATLSVVVLVILVVNR